MSHKAAEISRQERARQAVRDGQRRRRWIRMSMWGTGVLAVGALLATMMLTSRPQSSDAVRIAPSFALTDTAGVLHTLAQHRGENVLLYFSEGAGCQSCLYQMAQIEKDKKFAAADLTVLPIVMNGRDQILADMGANGVRTPFLLDDGTVSREYGTLGKGMHAGLPGHSFVLIDEQGRQRWYGEYPSMWLAPDELLDQVEARLG